MIYTEAFGRLPAVLKSAIYARLWEILSGREKALKYARLSAADRRAVTAILLETIPDLPDYFRTARGGAR
jgi:hypothetical protein